MKDENPRVPQIVAPQSASLDTPFDTESQPSRENFVTDEDPKFDWSSGLQLNVSETSVNTHNPSQGTSFESTESDSSVMDDQFLTSPRVAETPGRKQHLKMVSPASFANGNIPSPATPSHLPGAPMLRQGSTFDYPSVQGSPMSPSGVSYSPLVSANPQGNFGSPLVRTRFISNSAPSPALVPFAETSSPVPGTSASMRNLWNPDDNISRDESARNIDHSGLWLQNVNYEESKDV